MLDRHRHGFMPADPRFIPSVERYSSLVENWKFSFQLLERLRSKLAGALSDNVECVAMAGSFGRLEGSSSSDADYILVVKDAKAESVTIDRQTVNDAIKAEGVSPPNKSGVFAVARDREELISLVGKADEQMDVLGKRMLLLLESRPLFGDEAFTVLLRDIFLRYAEYLEGDPSKEFAFLLNDLIRYFRFICVNYQSSFWRENEKWPLRNLKLRHSRVLMYSGLLLVLGEASKYTDERKTSTVWQAMPLTPLERLAWVYSENHDHSFFRVVGLYNVFLSRLSDAGVRAKLNALEYKDRYSSPVFAELKANSDAFVAELLRFVLARRGTWSERFFEYLMF